MPSIPTHFLVGAALGQTAGQRLRGDWRYWVAALVCSALPDVDVIGFGFGVRYGDLWGHRGMTHSILFAVVAGIFAGSWFGGRRVGEIGQGVVFFFFSGSHGGLGWMKNGGGWVSFRFSF